MDNKIKIKIAVAAFVLAAVVIGGLTWWQNRELKLSAQRAAERAQTGVTAPQASAPEKPQTDLSAPAPAPTTNTQASATTTAATAATTIKKISCSFKAKEGSRSDKAKVTWDCSHEEGWTCDILQDYVKKSETRLRDVDLPDDSAEVDADEATTKTTTVTSGSGESSEVETVTETPNNYRLECTSSDNKVRNFTADTYWNENE